MRDLIMESVFLACFGEFVCFCWIADNDSRHTGSSSFRWNVFTLQLRSISCGALTPSCSLILPDMFIRETWPAVKVSHSAVGTLIQLWLTGCHGNPCPPTTGQKFVLSPCAPHTVGIKCLTAKILLQYIRFHLLCCIQTWMNFEDFPVIKVYFWWTTEKKKKNSATSNRQNRATLLQPPKIHSLYLSWRRCRQ